MTPARKTRLDPLAISLLLACCVFWGFQQVLVKATVAELAPLYQAGLRFALASVLLAGWASWRGIRLWERDGLLAPGLLVGALFAGEFACIYLGLQFTQASRLTVLLYGAPFWLALLLPRFVPGESLGRSQWIGMALAFAGLLLAVGDPGGDTSAQPRRWIGDALGLLAGALWALTTLALRATRAARLSPEKQLFYQVGTSALLFMPLSFALHEPWLPIQRWSYFATASIVAQAAVGAFASYLCWMWMLARYPATRLSSFVFLTPLFALGFGAAWLGEPVTAVLLSALALVAAGIVLVNRRSDYVHPTQRTTEKINTNRHK